MLAPSTLQLLRFHFSFFLLPVYLFALSQLPVIDVKNAILVFIILHILIYPASNGYNSYMDRDESPIGGIKNPKQPTKQLYYVTIFMDLLAVLLGLLISPWFSLGTLLYIMASRLYSYRRIRLKQYPVLGYLTVFVFQGALIFFISYHGCHPNLTLNVPFLPCIISSMLIGALYPLSQIYQHEEDRKDGVITISYLVGKRGTFFLSMSLFLAATFLFYLLYNDKQLTSFYYYLLIMLPVVLFFLYWMSRVWRNESEANYGNSLRMNILATFSTTVFFLTRILLNH
ncbi:MAG TPA: UbiA family prenyltransferase [Chitinophagaceae bacterium]